MNDEQMARIVEEINLPAKDEHIGIVKKYVRRAANKAMLRCHRKNIPIEMELVIAEIAEAMLRTDQAVPTPEEKEVASISRGDTSIQYRDKGGAFKCAGEFIKDFEADLFPFKKMNLPRDIHERS